MGKATQKAGPVSLGTKRSCPKCGTKVYDFNKEDLACPKCDAKFKASESSSLNLKLETPKKAKKELPEEALMDAEDLVVGDNAPAFESVDELDDDEDEVVEDLDVEDEDSDR